MTALTNQEILEELKRLGIRSTSELLKFRREYEDYFFSNVFQTEGKGQEVFLPPAACAVDAQSYYGEDQLSVEYFLPSHYDDL